MLINKIQTCNSTFYTPTKINFKGKSRENDIPVNFFDDNYKKFSNMQRNYYGFSMLRDLSSDDKELNVVFPVNEDDAHYLAIQRSNIRKLQPEQRIMAFNCPNYTTDEAICSNKGFTDGIYDCIAVLIYNNDKAYLYHLSPQNYQNEKDIKRMQETIQSSITDLKEGSQRCAVFLYGGIRGTSDELYENISEILNKNGIQKQEAVFSKNGHIGHSIYFDIDRGIILSDEVYAYHSKQQLEENFEKVNLQNYFYSEIV